ncbi:hypothetical protein [Rhodohalobacter sp. 614A]|uniref:hypothetical protein n=1 Tax=Rhodohalobacter sp. 614A TaxID=2908649 RepID=UPI001F23F3E1|nr:hypothetical protein [Rhodohalobacter sp. 614A]
MDQFNSFIGKYFDKVYQVPSISNEKLKELFWDLINEVIEEFQSSYDQKSIKEELNQDIKTIFKHYQTYVTNFRNFKSFAQILKSNFKKLKRDLYTPDLILMSLIEAMDFKLFSLIKNNGSFFICDGLISTREHLYLKGIYHEKRIFLEGVNKTYGSKRLVILYDLFPLLKLVMESSFDENYNEESFRRNRLPILEEIEQKQKISHPLIFPLYFYSASSDKVIQQLASKNFKEDILKAAKDAKSIKDICDKLKELFPKEDSFEGYRRLSLNWVHRIIRNEGLLIAKNILIAISWLAKDLKNDAGAFYLSEKREAAYLIATYLSRKKDDYELLIELQGDKSSDEFATTVIYQIMDEDNAQEYFHFDENIKGTICFHYLLRIKRRLEKKDSIFNQDIFDDYKQSIWRWMDAEAFLLKNEEKNPLDFSLRDYLTRELKESINYLDLFLDMVVTTDYGRKLQVHLDTLKQLMTEDEFKKVLFYFRRKNELKNLSQKNYLAIHNSLFS